MKRPSEVKRGSGRVMSGSIFPTEGDATDEGNDENFNPQQKKLIETQQSQINQMNQVGNAAQTMTRWGNRSVTHTSEQATNKLCSALISKIHNFKLISSNQKFTIAYRRVLTV